MTNESEESKLNNALRTIFKLTPVIFSVIIAVVLGVNIGSFEGNDNILRDLSDPAVARGLITLLFAFATIWVAMILTLAAIDTSTDKDKFNRAKDILTILVGIFGTIIGYYFGAESEQTEDTSFSTIIHEEKQLPNSKN